ncbi:hypothetical protein V2G26_009480 [Clonostachys chloroleuca]
MKEHTDRHDQAGAGGYLLLLRSRQNLSLPENDLFVFIQLPLEILSLLFFLNVKMDDEEVWKIAFSWNLSSDWYSGAITGDFTVLERMLTRSLCALLHM